MATQQQVQIPPISDAQERHKLASIVAAVAYDVAYELLTPRKLIEPDEPKGEQ